MLRLSRALFIALALLTAALPAQAARAPKTTLTAAGDMMLGDPKAKVQVVEYASLTCPHCARFNQDVFAPFKARYVDTGKAGYTLKEMLTSPPEVAAAGFMLARCTGQDRYFSVVDEIFKNQDEMFGEAGPRPVLLRIAQGAGLNEAQFLACIRDEKALDAVYARAMRAGRDDKINSTPTVMINGKLVAEGEMTFADLEAAIAKARKARR